jgi:outer membrane translocation and assembly module TamA
MQINSEYRFPITDRYWGGAIFVDTGNAWEKGTTTSIDDLHWGAGLGLRLFIKRLVNGIGRLDVAYNFSDDEVEAYLGLGHTF